MVTDKKQKRLKIKEGKVKNLPIQGFYINELNELYVQTKCNEIFRNQINKIIFIENKNYKICGRLQEIKISGIILKDYVILNRG